MTKEHIDISIEKALRGESNIDKDILSIRGFSTPTMRHLFNNLCNIDGCNYLEVGLYCGATFCSSFNKDTISVGIEDFSQDFGVDTVKNELLSNIESNKSKSKSVKLIEGDCFSDSILNENFKFNILFWDGEHSFDNQKKAVSHFLNYMDDTFILIIDDFSWEQVSKGTLDGLKSISDKINIINGRKIFGDRFNDDHVWHNGLYIALITKK